MLTYWVILVQWVSTIGSTQILGEIVFSKVNKLGFSATAPKITGMIIDLNNVEK